jgi:Flp pilus assembly protein TadD
VVVPGGLAQPTRIFGPPFPFAGCGGRFTERKPDWDLTFLGSAAAKNAFGGEKIRRLEEATMTPFAVGSSALLLTVSFTFAQNRDGYQLCKGFPRGVAWVTLVVLIALVLAQAQSYVESGTSFQGRVQYENDAPAQFAQVELWTDGETSWRTTAITDRSGKFHTGAPCMVIQYKVEVPGFRPVWGRVDMSMKPCHALESITLKAMPGTKIPDIEGPPWSTVDARVTAIPPDAKREFDAGQQAINDNHFMAAIPYMQKAISLYPKYAEAYQLLGVAQLQTTQIPQAESSLVKALEIEDRMPRVQYLLGVLYAKTNRVDLAEKPFSRFADLDPQNPDAHFELAKVCFALNRFPDAEMHARKSMEFNETNTGVLIVLGYALLRQNKLASAKQSFQQFLKLDPNNPMAADVKAMITPIDNHAKK